MTTIRPLRNDDARAVARLHAQSITEGFLTRLGVRFLATLYRGIAQEPGSFVHVADVDGAVSGFCAFSIDVSAMYKRVLRARFFRLGFASLPYSLNPWLLREVFETLRYPAKQGAQALPPAEILSIAVDSATRGAGLGKKLLDETLERARQDGVERVKVLAGAKLDGANRFYIACGFIKAAELVQHGGVLNVYTLDFRPTT